MGENLNVQAAEEVGMIRCGSSSLTSRVELPDDAVHVLVVDDSPVDRKVVERLLKVSSCNVTCVDSAIKALKLLGLDEDDDSNGGVKQIKLDLVITDYSMPGMTGYELLKKLKGSTACNKTPVVIMSSENIPARVDKCIEDGAEEFIEKPLKLSDVRRMKDSVIKSGRESGVRPQMKRKIQESIIASQCLDFDVSLQKKQSLTLEDAECLSKRCKLQVAE